jgi:hypothetical protein
METKRYAVVIYMDVGANARPAAWDWDDLIGETLHEVTVYEVTDEEVPSRIRLTPDGLEEV